MCDEKYYSIEENVKYLLDKGVNNLIVTLGSEGSLFINKKETIKIPAYKVKAVDTTGAGDCYNGFFTGFLALGYDIEKALDLASKASAISVTKEGTIKSYPNINEI